MPLQNNEKMRDRKTECRFIKGFRD